MTRVDDPRSNRTLRGMSNPRRHPNVVHRDESRPDADEQGEARMTLRRLVPRRADT